MTDAQIEDGVPYAIGPSTDSPLLGVERNLNPRDGFTLSIAGLAAFWREPSIEVPGATSAREKDLWLISRSLSSEHKNAHKHASSLN